MLSNIYLKTLTWSEDYSVTEADVWEDEIHQSKKKGRTSLNSDLTSRLSEYL